MYIYIAIICIHIPLFSRPVPVYLAFRPPTPISFFQCLSVFRPVFSLPSNIPFIITGDESRAVGTRSYLGFALISLPLSRFPTHPVLQLALRSIFLPHFAFKKKVRLSLPNNVILSLDTSPCEGGRRLRRFTDLINVSILSTRQPSRRQVFLFFFLLFLLIPFSRLYSQLNMIFFFFHGTDATGHRINLINLSY